LADLSGWEHPDVTALATKASNKPLAELAPVDLPPMLWKSWVLLIEASNTRPDLVPVETWRRTVTTLPRRPFLIWSPQEDRAAVKAWEEGMAPLVQPPAPQRDFGGVVRGAPAAERAAPAETQDEARRRLTAQLLAPRAAIDELASD
jgi:hypothetical protein